MEPDVQQYKLEFVGHEAALLVEDTLVTLQELEGAVVVIMPVQGVLNPRDIVRALDATRKYPKGTRVLFVPPGTQVVRAVKMGEENGRT